MELTCDVCKKEASSVPVMVTIEGKFSICSLCVTLFAEMVRDKENEMVEEHLHHVAKRYGLTVTTATTDEQPPTRTVEVEAP